MRLTPVLASVLLLVPTVAIVTPGVPLDLDLTSQTIEFTSHGEPAGPVDAKVVAAHIDTGINPYHEAFRWDDPQAYQHPSTYLNGYPQDAERLDLSLNASSWEAAFEADRAIWEDLLDRWENETTREEMEETVFWIPGTRIVAAKRVGPGGTACTASDVPPGSYVNDVTTDCTDWPLLDDHGHGTMTASRMAGDPHSLAPDALVVSLEGLGADAVTWAADAGWIDVQSNSWGSLFPHPAGEALGGNTSEAIEAAAEKQLVLFASGNGAGGFFGGTPSLTWKAATAPPGIVLVGAHDNGYVSHWSGAPAHVVADGYAGYRAHNRNMTAYPADPVACCTSAASPYAAGGAAAIVQEARRLLGDTSTGWSDGVVASGDNPALATGPLADGELNLTELRDLLLRTAEARPDEGKDDGALHWLATPDEEPDHPDWITTWGAGANPYCQLCTTDPVAWPDVRPEAPAYASIGYGAVNERSVALATLVLRGHATAPDRSDAGAFFAADGDLREALHDDLVELPGNLTAVPQDR